MRNILQTFSTHVERIYFDGLVQDWSNSIANSLELLQSCKPLPGPMMTQFTDVYEW